MADAYEQLGYQQENPGLRNAFLAGAFELRWGIPEGSPPKTAGPDMIRAMTTGLFLDFLGIRMDSTKAEDFEFSINLITLAWNGRLFERIITPAVRMDIEPGDTSTPV